jgi:hypothetical protein
MNYAAFLTHCTVNRIYVFPEIELRCLVTQISYIHGSVSDLYISVIGLPISLQNRQTDPGNI